MFDNNPKFKEFREMLHHRGVNPYFTWSTKRNRQDRKQKYDDVAFAVFRGNGFAPRIATGIFIDYGKDGFGLYLDCGEVVGKGLSMEEEADLIAGPTHVKLKVTA